MKSVLFGHLSKIDVTEGQSLHRGDVLGVMGDTGQSFGAHLHIVVAESEQEDSWNLASSDRVGASQNATDAFLREGPVFARNGETVGNYFTTYWREPGYEEHAAYDIITASGSGWPDIVWPSAYTGRVVKVGDHGSDGYGLYIVVQFPMEEDKPQQEESEAEEVYIVKSGDTLSEIGDRYGIGYEELAAYNGIENPSLIYPGQEIRIPGTTAPKTYTVEPGDSWWAIAERFLGDGARYKELAAFNGRNPHAVLYSGTEIKIP